MVSPARKLYGTVTVMGDKSISHRFAMLAPLAEGLSVAENFLLSEDTLATLECMGKMGVHTSLEGSTLKVYGTGQLCQPTETLYAANSGTTMRLLCGLLVGQGINCTISGDHSLEKRPMNRAVKPLAFMGADISSTDGYPPLVLKKSSLKGICYTLPVQSAQIKSAILLAGLGASGQTTVEQSQTMRDHTERMLIKMGAHLVHQGNLTTISPVNKLNPLSMTVPMDISSAAYFICGALLLPGSQVTLKNVGLNPTRMGLVSVLQRMGAELEISNRVEVFEPYGDITVKYTPLTNITVENALIPSLIDEIPLLALLGCFATGTMKICGVGELRHKESDRFSAIIEGFNRVGGILSAQGDDLLIQGTGGLTGGIFDALEDHRLAMTYYIAALASKKNSEIIGGDCVSISFPSFYEQISQIEVR